MHDGTVRTGLKKNLLSLGQLDDLGCKVEIQNNILKIIKGALVLMREEKVSANLYQLKGEIIEDAEASVASHSPSHRVTVTWHQKLGYISKQGMKIIVERKLLPGLTKVSLPFCEHCVISKQHRLNGFIPGKRKYFVSFIDDYSRRCSVYPIKKKSNVYEVYKARVELDSGKKIKCLRTDNRVELKTPMEMWMGKPVNYSNLYLVGSHVYVMYNTQETTKLDLKSKKCLFLGYANVVKGYHRLWDPTAHKVFVSRDVVFMEDKIQENEKEHEVNETTESQTPTTRTSDREIKRPVWQSDYVMESNIAYCLLTEKGESSTLQEALNNLDMSFWKEDMQKEIEALHKNKTPFTHARMLLESPDTSVTT
nr:Gag-Pol polyprotein [Tanacetum cinerariifolium]